MHNLTFADIGDQEMDVTVSFAGRHAPMARARKSFVAVVKDAHNIASRHLPEARLSLRSIKSESTNDPDFIRVELSFDDLKKVGKSVSAPIKVVVSGKKPLRPRVR